MSLVPRFVLGALDLTDYPFGVGFGSDLGNPENVSDVLASLLADGEIESLSRRSNRTMTIPILIDGTDLADLAAAEQLLIAECDKQRNTLSIDPGDDNGATTIFDTFAAQAVREYDDDTELAGYRRWDLTIKALPFGRSTTGVVDAASTPPSSGGTLLYDCESITGWSRANPSASPLSGGVFSVDSVLFSEGAGAVKANVPSWPGGYEDHSVGFEWHQVTGLSLATSAGGYMSVDIRTDYADTFAGAASGLYDLKMQVAGSWVTVPSFVAASRDELGFVTYVWPVAASLTVTGLTFGVVQYRAGTGNYSAPHIWFDNVELLPAATTDHQIIKQITVEGSARTSASLHVAAPSDAVALGQVLAITSPTLELPAGFQPDGRRWITQGGTTSDASALHGSYLTPNTTAYDATGTKPIFDVPANMLTAGAYTIVALVKAESSTLLAGVQAQLRVGSTNVGPTSAAEVSPTGLTTGWQFITVGTVYLPPLPMQSADDTTKVRLLFKGAKLADIFMIPAWQVGGRPVADFSIVDCGSSTVAAGGSSSNLWIDSPSTDQPQGGWWRGPTSDRANAQSAWPDAKKPGIHAFNPGSLTAFLVSTGAAGPTLTLEYFPAWFGMAAS